MTKTCDGSFTEEARILHGPTVRAQILARRDSGLLVDAHVHVHDCFDPGRVFDCAAGNFKRAASTLSLASKPACCLLLAENPTDVFFDALKSKAEIGGWRIEPTKEACSLVCRRMMPLQGESALIVIAGRQIVVRERLEVLALCCAERFPVGRSLKSTLEQVIQSGALPVLPWGFGKWWFGRGRLVRKALESGFGSHIWLGDNGNRLRRSPRPRLFRTASKRGVGVLPGSDPLPMRARERDAGRCGFFLDGEVDFDRPAAWIKAALQRKRASGGAVRSFGRRETVARFCISQIAMQFRRTV